MTKKSGFFAFFCFAALVAAGPAIAQSAKIDKNLKQLGSWMTGSFDTFGQVDEDEEADAKYRHIRALLHVTPVDIPELRDGLAFYVENQQAEARTKPYRQRVYFLTRIDGKITLRIFRISKPEDLINAHKRREALKSLSFDRLSPEVGCDLTYERAGKDLFKGRTTGGKACRSSLRGATYTYSESEIGPRRWINLDQGFDDAGNHKWGPPPGTIGHIFLKRE
ncbi:MAG: chromophore lyase CpcT/CpeT [Acidobacteria bacterium]|nr:chromophore lyase CpcT/CpeT [Acidobacteriota bacterium]